MRGVADAAKPCGARGDQGGLGAGAKAFQIVLQAIVDREFSPFSFGGRPRRGRQDALATALAIARIENRWVWVTGDVEQAFDRLPFRRLLDACARFFPCDVAHCINVLAYTGKRKGIRQGSPLSPLLANLFFHHFLDSSWILKHPDLPSLRFIDDLLVTARGPSQGVDAAAALKEAAIRAGAPLKPEVAVCNLLTGQSVDWLGYLVRREGKKIAIRIAEKSWAGLYSNLAEAHCLPQPALHAPQIVEGWIDQLGPAYAHEDRGEAIQRLRETAAELSFTEIQEERDLIERWAAAHARWHRLFEREAALVPHRLQRMRMTQ